MVTRIVCLNFGVFSATGVVSAKQLVASPNQTSTATEQNVYTEKIECTVCEYFTYAFSTASRS